VDARAHIFVLGVVLYHMVSERRPFGIDTQAKVITAISNDNPPPMDSLPLRQVPASLERLMIGRSVRTVRRQFATSGASLHGPARN
jgi:hypothetical protein